MRNTRRKDHRNLAAAMLAAAMLWAGGSQAATVWDRTASDADVNILDSGSGSVEFGLFDDSNASLDPTKYLPLASDGDTVSFARSGGDWNVENDAGNRFTLTDSDKFRFGAKGSDDGSWVAPSGYSLGDVGGSYKIAFPTTPDPSALTAVDVHPMPVPAALWLFGSGLIGLAGIARRRTGRGPA